MARSFWTVGDDAHLYTGSAAFSAQITADPTGVGLVAAQASAYAALHATFGSLYLAASNPDTRTAPVIVARNEARTALKIKAAELAKIIDATPTVTNEQRTALGLNVRKPSEPAGAPGTPEHFVATFNGDGGLDVTFRCKNPFGTHGTMYQLWRRSTPTGEYEYLGGVGDKKFTDSTIPAGSSQLTYKVQAVRSTAVGAWASFNVTFGIGTGGGTTATVTEAPKTPKAA